jgi:cell division protein FtsA
VGYQRSRGVKAGVVVDFALAEEAVKAAIAQAERMAGVTLTGVLVSVSCGRLSSRIVLAHADTPAGIVAAADVARLAPGARAYAEQNGRRVLHMNRTGWRLDGVPCPHDPEGLPAHRVSADLNIVTADDPPVRNLLHLVERCYVKASGLVASPHASAMSVTSEEERRLGVTVVDLGAGTSTLAQFAEGELVRVDAIPQGGAHLTADIARALHTPLEGAERIKALYGTVLSAPSDEHEIFSYPVTGEEGSQMQQTAKARLAEIIRPRLQSIFGLVCERTGDGGAGLSSGGRVVLTGGSSEITGIQELASVCLGLPVRLGRPGPVSGLPPMAQSPQFATAAGLVELSTASAGVAGSTGLKPEAGDGYFERVGQWLKDGF